MGKCIIDGNLDKEGFFQSHLEAVYSSTFPPTTVAATTSMLSGMNPCEHGWLGWDCYFPQINKNVTVFEQGDGNRSVCGLIIMKLLLIGDKEHSCNSEITPIE